MTWKPIETLPPEVKLHRKQVLISFWEYDEVGGKRLYQRAVWNGHKEGWNSVGGHTEEILHPPTHWTEFNEVEG